MMSAPPPFSPSFLVLFLSYWLAVIRHMQICPANRRDGSNPTFIPFYSICDKMLPSESTMRYGDTIISPSIGYHIPRFSLNSQEHKNNVRKRCVVSCEEVCMECGNVTCSSCIMMSWVLCLSSSYSFLACSASERHLTTLRCVCFSSDSRLTACTVPVRN